MTANDLLYEDICNDAFAQTEKMLHKLCWKFQSKYGGDIEDWQSEAHMAFITAIAKYNPNQATKFSSWLYNIIRWTLLDFARNKAKRRITQICTSSIDDLCREKWTTENSPNIDEFPFKSKNEFHPCFLTLIEHASDSVIELWHIINYPPPELIEELDPEDPVVSWDAIHRFCLWTLKWSCWQMRDAIKELKEICSE